MTKEEFLALDPSRVTVLDVREPEELAALPSRDGAVNIAMSDLIDGIDEDEIALVPKEKPVVTLCQSGGRAARMAALLKQQGWDADYVIGGLEILNQ